MEAGVERDVFVLAGVEASQLHGAFDGFGASVAEKGFGQALRRDVRELFGQIGDRFHVINVRGTVDQLFHLRLGGSDNLGIAMSGVHHRDAGETVEILAAVLVGHNRTAGPVNHNRHNRLHEAGHYVVFVFLDSVGHGDQIFLCVPSCPLGG